MTIVFVDLTPAICRLRGSWQLSASWFGPAGPQRTIVLEGVPQFDSEIDLVVVSTSGPLPVPDWIRFTVLQDSGNPEKEIQVLYCPERNLEGAASEPVMFQVVVELPMGLFDALWKIVSGTPIARVKVGTSFTAKDDVSGHFPILEITDLEKGCASTTGHQFWFDVSS